MTGSTKDDRLIDLGNGEFMIKNARASFLHVFKAQESDDGEPKFRGTFLVDKDRTALLDDIEDEIYRVAHKKWGDELPRTLKLCLSDGDEKDYDGYADHMAISASERTRPAVLDRDRSPLTFEDGRPYSGCYVNVIVSFWALDHKKAGKRVCANLRGVQFVRDGDSFSGAPPLDPSKFDEIPEEEDRPTRGRGGRDRDERPSRGRGDTDREERSSRSRDDRGGRGGREEREERPARSRGEERTHRSRDEEFQAPRGRDREASSSRGRSDTRSESSRSRADRDERPARGRARDDWDD